MGTSFTSPKKVDNANPEANPSYMVSGVEGTTYDNITTELNIMDIDEKQVERDKQLGAPSVDEMAAHSSDTPAISTWSSTTETAVCDSQGTEPAAIDSTSSIPTTSSLSDYFAPFVSLANKAKLALTPKRNMLGHIHGRLTLSPDLKTRHQLAISPRRRTKRAVTLSPHTDTKSVLALSMQLDAKAARMSSHSDAKKKITSPQFHNKQVRTLFPLFDNEQSLGLFLQSKEISSPSPRFNPKRKLALSPQPDAKRQMTLSSYSDAKINHLKSSSSNPEAKVALNLFSELNSMRASSLCCNDIKMDYEDTLKLNASVSNEISSQVPACSNSLTSITNNPIVSILPSFHKTVKEDSAYHNMLNQSQSMPITTNSNLKIKHTTSSGGPSRLNQETDKLANTKNNRLKRSASRKLIKNENSNVTNNLKATTITDFFPFVKWDDDSSTQKLLHCDPSNTPKVNYPINNPTELIQDLVNINSGKSHKIKIRETSTGKLFKVTYSKLDHNMQCKDLDQENDVNYEEVDLDKLIKDLSSVPLVILDKMSKKTLKKYYFINI